MLKTLKQDVEYISVWYYPYGYFEKCHNKFLIFFIIHLLQGVVSKCKEGYRKFGYRREQRNWTGS